MLSCRKDSPPRITKTTAADAVQYAFAHKYMPIRHRCYDMYSTLHKWDSVRRETTTLHTSNICYTPVLLRYFHYILLSNWGRHEARFFLSWIHKDRIVIHTSKYISCPKLRVVCDALSDLLSYHQVLFSGWSCQKTCPWGMYPAYLVLSDIKSVKTASQTLSFSLSLSV